MPASCLSTALLAALCATSGFTAAADDGLVARYTFDEGAGSVAHDVTGNGNDGTTVDARYVKTRAGFCLEFNGVSSVVECGSGPSFDLRDAITLEAWVCPTGRAIGEPGIMGKHFQSYLLTYYTDGQAYWYVGRGGHNANAPLPIGVWHHVAATFDGKELCLYLNGRLASTRPSEFAKIPSGGEFLIGAVRGAPDAADPHYTRTAHFLGMIDDVRVYNRALSATEIAEHAAAEARRFEMQEPFSRVSPAATLRAHGMTVRVGERGEIQLDAYRESYLLQTWYSWPGDQVGWNSFARDSSAAQATWRPTVAKSGSEIRVSARGQDYTAKRRIFVDRGALVVEDTLTGLPRKPVGLLVHSSATCRHPFTSTFAPGGAEHPTIYAQGRRAGLGIIMEDDVSRLRYQPLVGLRRNSVGFRMGNIALAPDKALTFRWAYMPLAPGSSYWDFTNAVRRRWNTNFTVQGPFSWICVTDPILNDPQALRAYLQRKRVRLMALTPWLDYDPHTEDHVWPREQYKLEVLRAVGALKAADPNILCLGCIETDWVTIYPEQIPGGEALPVAGTGASGRLSPEQTRIMDQAGLPWADSVKRDAEGCLTLELYMRGGKPQTALAVYPAVGNYQYQFLMGQVRFLLDEIGLDGYYMDEFSQGWTDGIRSYQGWDGVSAEVDVRTGKIQRLFVDCSLAGVEARVRLIRYALDRGKVVVANTYATAMAEQALPVNRFSETQGAFDPMIVADGEKPPAVATLFRSNLASPIGLGIIGHPEKHDTARRIMKAVITYLRHGMVYYHYAIEDIPETGEGSGEYGPINHMFPITPVELREGCIVGRERIVTCVSGTYRWEHPKAPRVLIFDLDGRLLSNDAALKPEGKGWRVGLALRDWAEIAVIESAE